MKKGVVYISWFQTPFKAAKFCLLLWTKHSLHSANTVCLGL